VKFDVLLKELHRAKFLMLPTNGRDACEACSAMWNLGTNLAFIYSNRKTLIQFGASQDLLDAN
jgi:hypothetical protein